MNNSSHTIAITKKDNNEQNKSRVKSFPVNSCKSDSRHKGILVIEAQLYLPVSMTGNDEGLR